MENLTHNKAVQQNLIHMESNISEWSALPIEKFTVTENNKGQEIVMPEFKFPVNYNLAPTLYNDINTCGWCGHNIKFVFWIVNHNKKWLLPVGCECIKSFMELTPEQAEEIKVVSTVKPEEVQQINSKLEQGITIKQTITATRKQNTIEKRFLKKYPMPDQELESWWKSILDKWDYSWQWDYNRDFQYWGLRWDGIKWPMQFDSAYDYLRLPKPNTGEGKTAIELWERYKKLYIDRKLSA